MTKQKIKIGIQGDKGSANEKACIIFAKKYKLKNYKIKYLITTENVLKALNKDEIDYGTFAWESSRSGLVQETQNAVKKYSFQKINEIKLKSDHSLLCLSIIDKTKTINIYSHPQALKEHKTFLKKEFKKLKLIKEIDTAVAAKKLHSHNYPKNSIVIAPISCAKIYNLKIYLKNLPTNKNYTTTIYLVKK